MNISNTIENLVQQTFQVSQPQGATSRSSNQAATLEDSNRDKAQVSAAASQVAQSSATSEVRLDKVASIQAQLKADSYSVPASAVAQKVISSMLGTEN
jgi:anti-sigma28 factor (negative regulator of flagellin synthesis)